MQAIERQVMWKLFTRIAPLLIFLYIVSFIDRSNVSFASLTMNKDIGLDSYYYGLGAGIFFIGYFVFEIPSNLLLVRFGARIWIARILFSWGIVATLMALVEGVRSFLFMRFLLGLMEAGLVPGVLLYLTYWFPARYRGRMTAWFMLAIPLSLAIGAPVATWIMQFEGVMGLHGWQWLFIIEGIPAILSTALVLYALPDKPTDVSWLSAEEKHWLELELSSDFEEVVVEKSATSAMSVFTNKGVWVFTLVYVASCASLTGFYMFFPQIIKNLGFSLMQTGWISGLAYLIGAVGLIVVGHNSDRVRERKWHLIVCFVIGAIALATAGTLGYSMTSLAFMYVAFFGFQSLVGVFWPLATAYMSGKGCATGLAMINSVGSLGSFIAPFAVGAVIQATDSFAIGFYGIAGMVCLAVILLISFVKVKKNKGSIQMGVNS